ncbi:aminotransferase class V-fold PLP-dependent enzyme [Actinocorallia populi]|uniref:aminotransferase class V-fold PLP-dependent enzyme n=1 Tax=Actinocorallia populi TaxID=2079200 RepID=UPI001E327843|nr:aminotransferase class V-fold PLP-dependent enzyme [Actinocorallia populi]
MSVLTRVPTTAEPVRTASAVAGDLERARETVRAFLGGPQAVVFTGDAADAFRLLARALPAPAAAVVFEPGRLPWRNTVRLPVPAEPIEALRSAGEALRACPQGPRLLVVPAASPVTGEPWPVRELADLAHRHGARIAVDAVGPAALRPQDARDLDYVVLSGQEPPFQAGVLAGRADWLRAARPGDVRRAGIADAERRHEAEPPNVRGMLALAAACETLIDRNGR